MVRQEPNTTHEKEDDNGKIDELNTTQEKQDKTLMTPRGIFKAQDKQLEEELNANLDIEADRRLSVTTSSSQGSFVRDTKNQVFNGGTSSNNADLGLTPDRVLHDDMVTTV
ncbi:unnamed protein product [Trifolium pratense]|uniref:Uncharacterized protein n=1 Tax=Trifolium pratense TaxID=57577 RepID=A0ACB0K4K4_TRIPR|nr:unnamed protein product [Trifolium pratense]